MNVLIGFKTGGVLESEIDDGVSMQHMWEALENKNTFFCLRNAVMSKSEICFVRIISKEEEGIAQPEQLSPESE